LGNEKRQIGNREGLADIHHIGCAGGHGCHERETKQT
jgi:hypothetical protein